MALRVATLVQRQYRHPGTHDRSAAELPDPDRQYSGRKARSPSDRTSSRSGETCTRSRRTYSVCRRPDARTSGAPHLPFRHSLTSFSSSPLSSISSDLPVFAWRTRRTRISKPRPRLRRAACGSRSCVFHRQSMAMAITASFRYSSVSRERRASRQSGRPAEPLARRAPYRCCPPLWARAGEGAPRIRESRRRVRTPPADGFAYSTPTRTGRLNCLMQS